MEPIRSEAQRGLDRKRRKAVPHQEVDLSGFSARLEETSSEAGEPATVVDLEGIPDVSAPAERLYDAVHRAGQRLLQERTYSAAQQYRETIRRFLLKVVPDAHAVEIHESSRDLLSRKRYYLITTVNSSVERLINGILQTQTRQLEILQRLEEIEGMLVDLMQ
ncbi:MAG: DUF327 family protein [Alkalispirochaeta sp.]